MNKRNFVSSLLVLAFFIFFYVCSGSLGDQAAYWPKLICVTGGVLSLLNAAVAGVKWSREHDQAVLFPLSAEQLKRSLLLLVLAAVWILLIPRVGYLVTTTVVTAAIVLLYEPVKDKKHVIRDIIVTVIFSAAVYELFALLGVHFPAGLLI